MQRTLRLLTLCSFETMMVIAFATCAALAQETAPSYAVATHQLARTIKASQFVLRIRCRQKPNPLLAWRDAMIRECRLFTGQATQNHRNHSKIIDRHECAYHQTGVIDRPHPPKNSPDNMMNESIADCIAILRMREETTNSQAQIKNVITALRQAMGKSAFHQAQSIAEYRISITALKKGTIAVEFIKVAMDHRAAN